MAKAQKAAKVERDLFGIQRRERILDELRTRGAVTVAELSATFDVTEITVRRDLAALADRGLVTRVHGGATLRSALDRTVTLDHDPSQPRFRIGMVVPTLNYYWPGVIAGARAAATAANAQLVLRGASYDPADQRRQIGALVDSGTVHGLIVAPETTGQDGAGILGWLDALDVPVVLAERTVPTVLALRNLGWVGTDHAFGAILAVHHLYNEGHQRIGLALPPHSPTSDALRQGWQRARAELGIDDEAGLEYTIREFDGDRRESALALLVERCRETSTTALLVHSDPEAIHLAHYCNDHGIAIPGDLALVAYDDEIAADGVPPITALRPPKSHIGRRAVESLLARLDEGVRRPVEQVQVLPELIVRASSRRPVQTAMLG